MLYLDRRLILVVGVVGEAGGVRVVRRPAVMVVSGQVVLGGASSALKQLPLLVMLLGRPKQLQLSRMVATSQM